LNFEIFQALALVKCEK